MRLRRWLLLPALLAFTGVSAWALFEHGYLALWRLPFQDSGTLQMFCDLAVGMLLVSVWMVRDARKRQVRVAPFLVLTVAAGSLGPLLYLLRLEVSDILASRARKADT